MTETERLRAALAEIRMLAADLVSDRTAEIAAIADAALEPPQPTPDTRPALTKQQRKVLDVLNGYIATRGRSPSFRELQVAMGYESRTGAVHHAQALRRKGYLTWDKGAARSFVVLGVSCTTNT